MARSTTTDPPPAIASASADPASARLTPLARRQAEVKPQGAPQAVFLRLLARED